MRDPHCKYCHEWVNGRMRGHNEYMKHDGGFIHTRCMEPYKAEMDKKYYPNSRTPRIPDEEYKKRKHAWYVANRDKINRRQRERYAQIYKGDSN